MTNSLFNTLWTITWQSAVLAAMVGMIVTIYGKWIPPRFRYLLWSVVLLRLMLPVLPQAPWGLWDRPAITPEIVTKTEPPMPPGLEMQTLNIVTQVTGATDPGSVHVDSTIVDSLVVQSSRWWNWKAIILAVWAVGVIVFAIRYGLDELRLYRRSRYWKPVGDPRLLDLLEQWRKEVGVWRKVELLSVSHGVGAAATGIFRPKILISEPVIASCPERLRMVLLHELIHIKRFDPLVLRLATLLTIIHWPNPAAWFTALRLQRERELACDAAVLDRIDTAHHREYGHTVVSFAELFSVQERLPGLVGVFQTNSISRRIDMIQSYKKSRYFHTLPGCLLVLALAGFGLTKAMVSQNAEKEPETQQETTKEPGTQRSEVSGLERNEDTVETPQLGLFETKENGQTTWVIRGQILLPDGQPAKNVRVFYFYRMFSASSVTDEKGYFVTRELDYDDGFALEIAGIVPVDKEQPWSFALAPIRILSPRDRAPEDFILPLQSGCTVSGTVHDITREHSRVNLKLVPEPNSPSMIAGMRYDIERNNAYCFHLIPGRYHIYWEDVTWGGGLKEVTIEPNEREKTVDLRIPPPVLIHLIREDGTQVAKQSLISVVFGDRKAGVTHYTDVYSDENGMVQFYHSPYFNILDYQNTETNEAAFVVLQGAENSSEPIKMIAKPFAHGKIRILDRMTGEPLSGLSVEFNIKPFSYEYERNRLHLISPAGRSHRNVVSNEQGEIEFPYMVAGVEYTVQATGGRPIGKSFIASTPGELTDFGVVVLSEK